MEKHTTKTAVARVTSPHVHFYPTEGIRSTSIMRESDKLHVRERSGSVVECLTRDQRAAVLSLTGVTALCP